MTARTRTAPAPTSAPKSAAPATDAQVLRRASVHETPETQSAGASDYASFEPGGSLVGTLAPKPPSPPENGRVVNFAGLRTQGASPRIDDQDEMRALATRQLFRELLPRLGIDPERLVIRVDLDAQRQLDARQATGLQENATIYLHPQRFRPNTAFGRYLVAHETVHAAQRANDVDCDVTAAEGEAHAIAQAFVRDGSVRKPVLALASSVAAAFVGSEADATTSAGADLEGLARENHESELSLMRKALSYGVFDWAITDDDVKDVLRVLESMAFQTQIELVRALEDPFPQRLADNTSPVHFKRFRTSILAAYCALVRRKSGVDALRDDPFAGMDFTALTPEEHYALREVIAAFRLTARGKTWYAGLKDRHLLGNVEDILNTVPQYDEKEQRGRAVEQERKRQKERAEEAEILKARTGDVAKFLEDARQKLTYHVVDWAITDGEVRSLLDDVAKFAEQPATLRAIVNSLEDDSLMDRWVDNVPVDDLYTDAPIAGALTSMSRRRMLLKLLVLRPPWKNVRMAEDLLSYGLFDWAITDEDAFFASQLVKALPERVRAGFYADGKYAGRLDEEQSLSMKKGRAANYYTGGDDGKDLQSIKAQLLDDGVWSKEQMGRLRQLIQMARAADEGPWVFAQSKNRFSGKSGTLPALYADVEFFQRVVQSFALFLPVGFRRPDGGAIDIGRTEYVPETVEGKPFGSDNVFASIGRYVRYLIDHTGDLQVQIIGDTVVGGEGLDFAEAQNTQGGALGGAEFTSAQGANRAAQLDNSLSWNRTRGLLDMRATRLDIANINYQLANLKIQTGAVSIRGLRLHLQYPTEDSEHKTTVLTLRVETLELNDVLLIGSDAMRGFEQIRLTDFFIDLSPDAAAAKLATLSDGLASGATELLKQGLLAPTTPQNLTVTAGEVLLLGMTSSSGQYVARIKLNDVALRTTAAPGGAGYRRWLADEKERLQTRLTAVVAAPKNDKAVGFDTAKSLTLQMHSVENELQSLSDAQADVQRLEPLVQSGKASAADANRLKRVKAYLAGVETGGVALDVGHAEAVGIAGKVAMGDVTLDDVHGWGHSAGAVLGSLSGSTALNRMLRGPEYRGTLEGVELEGDPMGFVKLGQIKLDAIDVQGDIPTPDDADKDLKAAEDAVRKNPYDPRLADEVERLRTRSSNTHVYWAALQKPSIGEADRTAFNDARAALLADKAFHADSVVAKGAVLELTNSGGTTSVGLDTQDFEARGLEARGLRVEKVTGKNLRVGGDIHGGLQALIAIGKNRQNLLGGAVSADELRLGGISHKYSGVRVEEVLVTALDAKASIKDGTSSLGIAAKSIEVTGVNWSLSERVLEMQHSKLLEKPAAARNKAEKVQLEDIEFLLGDIKSSKLTLADAAQHLMDPKLSEAEKQRYQQQKIDTEAELAHWQKKVELRKLTVRDLNIDIAGLGDVLADDYSIDRALSGSEGMTISGKGPSGQITSGISAEGAWMRLSAGKADEVKGGSGSRITASSQVGAESIETGPISGSLNLAADHVRLDGFTLESVELRDFRYFGGNSSIWSQSTTASRVSKVVIDATLETPLIDDEKPEGERYAAALDIRQFKIGEIAGDDIHYHNFKSGLQAELRSGRLVGIHAEGVRIDLPKTDNDALLIRGGTAGFARAENLRVAATTSSGMALSTTLNTGVLSAGFAADGKITADLEQISADAGALTQKDLDAQFNAKAESLHLEFLPGSKGYENAQQRFRLRGGEFSIDGRQGTLKSDGGNGATPTRFGATLKRIDTGEVQRDPDGTVRAPELQLPVITLDHLHFENSKFSIDVAKGSPVELDGTTASIVAEANPTPEDQRGKDESAFKRIVIKDLMVPLVTLHGLFVVIKDPDKGNMMLSLPTNRLGLLQDLHVGGADEKSEGFVIEPNENWQMFGKLGIRDTQLRGIGADLRSALIGSMDAKVDNFNVGFFGAEDTTVGFDDATLTALRGNLQGRSDEAYNDKTAKDSQSADSITARLRAAGFSLTSTKPGIDPKIHLHGFSLDKKGARLKSLDLAGLRYEDPDRGLTLDINNAAIPEGKEGAPGFEYTKDGKIKIPHAEITDAHFDIADILKVGGKGGAGASADDGLSYAPKLDVVDQLSGHANFTLEPFARGAAGLGIFVAGPFKFRIDIAQGKVNFKEMEDNSTGNIADAFVDLDYEAGKVDWDAKVPHMMPSRLQINIHVPTVDPFWWELDKDEESLAKTGFVNLSTFFKHDLKTEPGDPNKKTKESFLTSFFFGDVDVHLTLPGHAHVDLGTAGFMELGGDDKTPGFVMDVKSAALPAIKTTIPTFEANVSKLDLKLDTKGTRLSTGAIKIGGIKDGELRFVDRGVGPEYTDDDGVKTQNKLPMPEHLSGSVTQCSVDNLEVQLPSDEKATP